MTTETSADAFACLGCPKPKPASWCTGCSRETGSKVDPFHFVDGRLQGAYDIIVVSEAPVLGRGMSHMQLHTPYADDAGKIVTKTVENVRAKDKLFQAARVGKTYVVMCAGADPNKQTLDRCSGFLHGAIAQSPNPVILAMGMGAVKALGIKAAKLSDIQHRVVEAEVHGKKYTVIVTISAKQLVAMPGMYSNFENDVLRAFTIARTASGNVQVPLSEMTKDYVFPKNLVEVEELCEKIINYTVGDKPADQWIISADSETNTKFPHRKKLRILAASFAWDIGKACAIPLFHKDCPYDPEAALVFVAKVLASAKPKTFHNYKFDQKVFSRYGIQVANVVWDSMLGEHTLSEDKRGQYGLKPLTTVFYPQFAGYADHLHDLLAKEESESLLDTLSRQHDKEEAAKLAEALASAPVELDKKGRPKKVKAPKKPKQDGGFENIPLEDLSVYAAIDTDITRRLSIGQTVRMKDEEAVIAAKKALAARDTRRVFPVPNLCTVPNPSVGLVRNRAVPIAGALGRMELGGVRINRPLVKTLSDKLSGIIEESEKALIAMAARPDLKLNSAKDVADVLFNSGFIHPDTGQRMIYPPVTLTKKGQAQTTEKVLKFLTAGRQCPFSAKKLIYAKAYKAKNTFLTSVDALSEEDGFVHSNFNQHGTGTYRLSSSDINLQNIAKKLSGVSIKSIFVPDSDDLVFVNADAKGAEVRILTAYSKDAALIKSLNDGLDTHCFIASKIIEVVRAGSGAAALLKEMGLDDARPLTYDDFANRDDIKLVDEAYFSMLHKFRDAVKRVVFGILYGAGAAKIAETIGISKEQAQLIIDMLFQLFPSIPRYMEQTRWELRTFGMVETFFGHRRRFNVQGAAKFLQSRAERQGVNFKIQSTSSDIVMDCLMRIEQPLLRDFGGRLLLTVHDSLGFQFPKKYLGQLEDFLKFQLELETARRFPWLPVAFKWDFEVGPSYGELSPLKQYLAKNPIKEEQSDVKEAYTEEEIRIELADPTSE